MTDALPIRDRSRWPHRIAVVLVVATVLLIFVGGLVTTTESGMAVPDWPTSFGYGMFSFPIDQWLGNGWKVFVEHAHRLLGSTVGLITIAYVVALQRYDKRRWMWLLGGVTLVAVIFQGILGGTRVIENARTLAMIHGCFAPVFLALCVSNAVFTSRRWRDAHDCDLSCSANAAAEPTKRIGASASTFLLFTVILAAAAYAQIVLGARLRHLPVTASAAAGVLAVVLHLVTAVVLVLMVLGVGVFARRRFRDSDKRAQASGIANSGVRRAAHWVNLLLFVQVLLGCGTWIVNFGWPRGFGGSQTTEGFLIVAGGFWQTAITTAHQTTGSLILAACAALCWRTVAATHIAVPMGSSPSSQSAKAKPAHEGGLVSSRFSLRRSLTTQDLAHQPGGPA